MQENGNEEPPLDDFGIHQDRLLEICEKIIEKTHEKYVINDTSPKNAAEFRDVAETLEKVWLLTQDILNLDDVIRSAVEAMSDTPPEDDDFNDRDDKNTEDEPEF